MIANILAPFRAPSPLQLRGAIPSIDPVPAGVVRPFFSVMIPTYNRSAYLRQTLESVLAQDLGPEIMQIEVVDNCSTEGEIGQLVREIGRGRVQFWQQKRNVGMVPNWNTCIRRAQGHWIHILNDDDLVLPGFYETYQKLINQFPSATIAFSPSVLINESGDEIGTTESLTKKDGPVDDFLLREAISHWMFTPSVVVRRSVYESTGGFIESLRQTFDWEMWFRAGLLGLPITLTTPFSLYRIHSGCETNALVLTGTKECIQTTEYCVRRLPLHLRNQLPADLYKWHTQEALRISRNLGSSFKWKEAFLLSLWALRLKPSRTTFRWTGKALFHYVAQTAKRSLPILRNGFGKN
jgi:hypothetical protein